MDHRQIFPSSIEKVRLPSKNSALARIRQRRAELKASATSTVNAEQVAAGEEG